MKENFFTQAKPAMFAALIFGVSISFILLDFHRAGAAANNFYFDNSVNMDPSELGNYWTDEGLTEQALVFPDPNSGSDRLFVVSGATYDGDAVFQGNGTNSGTVTGDATFVNDVSENNGTVNGTKIRLYNSALATVRDFTVGGPWTVIADGVRIDVSEAVFDETTTFSEINGGSFDFISRVSLSAARHTITIVYNTDLDPGSLPDPSDFELVVNGASAAIEDIDISGTELRLDVAAGLFPGDEILLSYEPGSSPIQRIEGTDAAAFTDVEILFTIPVGTTPFSVIVANNKLYITNSDSNTVSVIDPSDDVVVETIALDATPTYESVIADKVYVNNTSGTVSIINSALDTVLETIATNAPSFPYYSAAVGTKIYVSDNNKLTIIDSLSDTIVAEPSVALTPFNTAAVGQKVYTAIGDNTLAVFDGVTDDHLTDIAVGTSPFYLTALGPKLYVNNPDSDNVSVVNTATDTVVATVSVGTRPTYSVAAAGKVYVGNYNSDNVSVISADTDTVVATVSVGTNPKYLLTLGEYVYVGNDGSDDVSVIDTATDTVVATVPVGDSPFYMAAFGSKIYVTNTLSGNVVVFDATKISSELPNLISFTTSEPNGAYHNGDSITITANFGRELESGSTMLVELNNGSQVMLGDVSGRTLSGTFIVTGHTDTPDLAVASIEDASVTDSTGTYTRTAYDLPSSVGDFEGENSFITRNIGDGKNIRIGDYLDIDVGDNPYQISAPINGYVYVANQGSDDVSVIELESKTVADTIDVGQEPYGLASVLVSGTTYLYVANINSDDVTVINTSTNEVVETIDVGVKPYYVAAVGTKVYVTNGASNSVSVINAATNTVIDTIPVGVYPRGIKAHGTDLYVANYGDPNYSGGNYISVIDSVSDSVTDTIVLPAGSDGPRGVAVLGDTLYVTNYRSNTVSVINTATNAVTDTIDVGDGPRGIVGYNGKVYVENFDAGTLSVIDTGTNTVTLELAVGHSPSGMAVVGTDIFLSSFQDGVIRVFDTATGGLEMEEQQGSNSTSSTTPRSKDWSVADPITKPAPTPNSPVPAVNPKPDPMLCHVFTTFMRRGSKFGEVAELQTRLKSVGFDPGPADGLFGPKTELAVKNFQEKNGIIRAGYVGPKTRAALNKVCETSIQY